MKTRFATTRCPELAVEYPHSPRVSPTDIRPSQPVLQILHHPVSLHGCRQVAGLLIKSAQFQQHIIHPRGRLSAPVSLTTDQKTLSMQQKTKQQALQCNKSTTVQIMTDTSELSQKRSDAQTLTTTKRQRRNRKRMNRLVEYWPELFNRLTPKPLKEGILDDLVQDVAARGLAFGTGALRAAVMSYTQCPRYYVALVAGGLRHDLNGQPCGEVTAEQQASAADRLRKIGSKVK